MGLLRAGPGCCTTCIQHFREQHLDKSAAACHQGGVGVACTETWDCMEVRACMAQRHGIAWRCVRAWYRDMGVHGGVCMQTRACPTTKHVAACHAYWSLCSVCVYGGSHNLHSTGYLWLLLLSAATPHTRVCVWPAQRPHQAGARAQVAVCDHWCRCSSKRGGTRAPIMHSVADKQTAMLNSCRVDNKGSNRCDCHLILHLPPDTILAT
eukprot:353534-Chlamydomonas_euryale.AAC.6